VANIYLPTKHYANNFIGDRDMAKNPNPRWQRPPSWIIPKVGKWDVRPQQPSYGQIRRK